MALTTNQVNASFLAILARPAEGSANTWASNFASVTDAASGIIAAQSKSNADFVTELYSSLLNRQADASGKAYWTGLLDAGQSKESVEKQFIAAVIAQGVEDPYNVDFVSLKTSTFVGSLYTNILSRAGDADGVAYWGGRLAAGLTRAELTNEFIGALAANPTTEDGQLFTAKIAVAEKFTNTFDNFSTLIPAEKQAAAMEKIKGDFANITASSSPDDYTAQFDSFKAEYQDIASQGFTRDPNDNLTSDTSTALYVGTVNIADATQGTIQSTDKAAGFADSQENSITVNVDGYNKDTANTLDLDTQMAALSGIQQMVINNGSAGVKGTVSAGVTNLTIAGAAAHEVNITSADATTVNINSAAKTEVTFTGTATEAVKYTGAAGNDNVTVANLGTSDFGAGDDVVVANTTIASGATISLGNGDDKLTITGTIAAGSNVTIDGGSNTAGGVDTLVLGNDETGIATIKNIEVIEASGAAAKVAAKAINAQKITIKADGATNKLEVDATDATSIDLSKLTDGTGDADNAALTLSNVAANTTIKLNAADSIAETIKLDATASKVTINGATTTEDVIDLAGVTTITATAWNDDMGFEANKAYMVTAAGKKVSEITATDVTTGITVAGTAGQAGQVFVKGTDGIAVYTITVNAASSAFEVGASADLILMGTQDLVSGDITLA